MKFLLRRTVARALPATAVAIGCVCVASAALAQTPAAPAAPPPQWVGTVGGGVSVTSGNSDTLNYNFAVDITRTPKARNVMTLTGLYLRGKQNEALVLNRTSLGIRDEHTLSGRTFVFAQVDYLRDTFKQIDYLVAPTGGVGFKVVDTDATKFSVDGGGGLVSEKNPGADLRTSAALTAGEKLTVQLTPTASFKHAATGLWKVDDFSDSLFTISFGLATKISERLQLSIDLLDTFKNKPPTAATKKNDVAFVTAITAKF